MCHDRVFLTGVLHCRNQVILIMHVLLCHVELENPVFSAEDIDYCNHESQENGYLDVEAMEDNGSDSNDETVNGDDLYHHIEPDDNVLTGIPEKYYPEGFGVDYYGSDVDSDE